MPRQRGKASRGTLKYYNNQILKEFCETTSIHGLRHIYEDGSLLFERCVWMLVFLSGVCFSGYFCFQMWVKWEQSPVLTSVETQLYPLKNVPFPAVTVCNVNKISESKLSTAIKGDPKFKNVSYSTIQTTLRYMTKLDRAYNNEEELIQLSQFYKGQNVSSLDLFRILRRTAPACTDMIMDCNWLGLPDPCMQFFAFLPTDDGMCCTFNGGKYFDTILGWIDSKQTEETLKVNGNGHRFGLTLVIDANLNDYSVTNGKFDGFKVLVHSPEEFPDVSDRGFVLGIGTETFAAVRATTSYYTEEVTREIPPSKRQCLATGEKELKYFQHYSRSACFVECDTQLMEKRCHCRPFFFKEEIRLRGDEVCNCLPPCTDTWYEPEISYASFPGRGFNRTRTFRRIVARRKLNLGSKTNKYLRSNVAMLHVYYKEKTGMRYKTDIRFGVQDFISAMGGLMGLGLGMSFISVIEIFYYLFFRRIFLWFRSNWSSQRNECSIRQENKIERSPVYLAKFKKKVITRNKKIPLPQDSCIKTISSCSLDGDVTLFRQGSLNLPAYLQARLNKY